MKKTKFSREFLLDEYENKCKSVPKLAKELKCGETTLYRALDLHKIKRRTSAENQNPLYGKEPSREKLINLHDDQHKSINEIAKIYKTSWGKIKRLFEKYQIKTKTHDEIMRPKNFIKPSGDELHKWIYDEGKTPNQIAKEKGVSIVAIRNYMREAGVLAKKRVLNRVLYGWWTKERVILEIKKIRGENGDLSANYCMQKRSSLFHAGYELFNRWENAIRSAGIDYSTILKRKKWPNKKEILNQILLLQKQGIDLSNKNIRKIRNDLISAAENKFGSWANAVNKAGIDYYGNVAINKNKYWTKEKIIVDIRHLHTIGHNLNSQSMQKSNNRDLFDAAKVKFGSWENAVIDAGFDYQKISKLKAQTKSFKEKLHAELTSEKLNELYVNQWLSTIELGILYDVSPTVISNLLKRYNIQLKRPMYGYKKPLLCKDGHKVKSNFERTVDDWLSFNGIEHKYDQRISTDRCFKSDFKIGRFHIEVLGMMEIPEYRKDFEEKIMHFGMKEGAGFICCKGEEVQKYKKYFDANNDKPIVILLIPKKHKLTKETINEQLGFLIPLFSKSQKTLK